jgi:hypothetical protein
VITSRTRFLGLTGDFGYAAGAWVAAVIFLATGGFSSPALAYERGRFGVLLAIGVPLAPYFTYHAVSAALRRVTLGPEGVAEYLAVGRRRLRERRLGSLPGKRYLSCHNFPTHP